MHDLTFNLQTAHADCDERRHATEVMKALGITYQHATPQSMGDCWWFWNCESIPDDLPKYLRVVDRDPMTCIGWGLSQEMAENIRDGRT